MLINHNPHFSEGEYEKAYLEWMKYTTTNKDKRNKEIADLMLTFVKRKSNCHKVASNKVLEWSKKIKSLQEIMNKDNNKNNSCDLLIEKNCGSWAY